MNEIKVRVGGSEPTEYPQFVVQPERRKIDFIQQTLKYSKTHKREKRIFIDRAFEPWVIHKNFLRLARIKENFFGSFPFSLPVSSQSSVVWKAEFVDDEQKIFSIIQSEGKWNVFIISFLCKYFSPAARERKLFLVKLQCNKIIFFPQIFHRIDSFE